MDITPIIVAVVMAIPGSLLFISQMKKDRVDSARLAMEMVEKLDKKIKDMEKTIGDMEETIESMEESIKLKNARIEELESKVDELETENGVLRSRLDVVESTRRSKPKTGG